jgi:hypothetical protein
MPFIKSYRKLEAGKVRSDATVWTYAESHVTVWFAREIEPVRVRKFRCVPIRGRMHYDYQVILLNGTPAHFDILPRSN